MTTFAEPPLRTIAPPAQRKEPRGRLIVKLLTTTDHKVIGHMYLVTSFVWFLLAGLMALIIRVELARPG